jgi:flagellar basal-body rod protein FlgF
MNKFTMRALAQVMLNPSRTIFEGNGMTNAVYAAVLGARVESMRMDVVANNVANADTPGFKADYAVFKNSLDFLSKNGAKSLGKAGNDISTFFDTTSSLRTGPIHSTGRKTDVAIDGDGFFVVQTPQGELYTRAGNFRTDLTGNLITSSGDLVMGDGGPIMVDPAKEISFGGDGTVYAGAEAVDKLRIVDFDRSDLKKNGTNQFTTVQDAVEKAEPQFTIIPEALEGSNVNVVREMSAMVNCGRQFEAYQRAIKLLDDVNSRSTNTLGRV